VQANAYPVLRDELDLLMAPNRRLRFLSEMPFKTSCFRSTPLGPSLPASQFRR
jgi:hypothetical protein